MKPKKFYYKLNSEYQAWRNSYRRLPEDNPLIVYTMRKVASTAVTQTLKDYGAVVYKHHCLNRTTNNLLQADLRHARRPVQHWLKDGVRFRKRLDKWVKAREIRPNDRRCEVVTLVKDPLAAILSDIFTQLFEYCPRFSERNGLHDTDRLCSFIKFLMTQDRRSEDNGIVQFLRDMIAFSSNWFETELHQTFGVNVLNSGFTPALGYQQYVGPFSRVILMRTEDAQRVAPIQLGRLLGQQIGNLTSANVTSEKEHGEVFTRLKTHLRLPRDLVEQFYDRSYARHFYTLEELKCFRSKWSEQKLD